jgi:uncharacterized protein
VSGRLSVAVVGGGVAGIVAAHLLARRNDVTLLEAADYLGGHTHTVTIPDGPDAGTPVDTGFIVHNPRTYPLFLRFLASLGVPHRDTDMSFSFHDEKDGFFWSGGSLAGLFARRRNLVSPRFYRMLADILRFNRRARADLAGGVPRVTLGEYLDRGPWGRDLRERYLLPMASAIWSTPPGEAGGFPAEPFIRFFQNHGLLQVRDRPMWRTIPGGSRRYVEAFLRVFPGRVLLSTPVAAVSRSPLGVAVRTAGGEELRFDRVVLAAHADQSLRVLADPDERESSLLGAWHYHRNRTVLHCDPSVLPPAKAAWAAWNYTREREAGLRAVSLSYWMNRLQGLSARKEWIVTLNRNAPLAPGTSVADLAYEHPAYTFASMATQRDLPALNGPRGTYFCGSYFGYGFHEDGVRSAVEVGRAFGEEL